MSKFQQLLLVFTIIAIIALIGFGVFQKILIGKKVDEFASVSNTLSKIQSTPGGATVETEEAMKNDMKYYKESIEVFNIAFKNIEGSQFSNKVGETHKEIKAKYDEACVQLPKEWYLGFEKYSNSVAPKPATGKLSYGLEAITYLHEELLKAKPQALINLYRKQILEELEGAQAAEGARESNQKKYIEMPLELTFAAKEKSVKQFINALTSNDKFFFTINTIKIKEVNGRRYACDRLEVVESAEELEESKEEESASIENALSGDEIVYSPKKKFDQVLGDESLLVFLDMNIVYIPKEEAPKGKAKKRNK